MKALVTRLANDVSTAVAEFTGGSEEDFARMMIAKKRQLGMNSAVRAYLVNRPGPSIHRMATYPPAARLTLRAP
ncbi:hypothetical protein [Chelativorans sp. Marseille-P2723]|uniref:hypothetical protein n=1 Tax=Chelativorans sp. Marseille-P2723 TaxID=2709133 RepID=UPI0032B2F0A9